MKNRIIQHKLIRKLRYFNLLIIVFTLLPFQLIYPQEESLKPWVAIVPMINTTKDDQYDAVCDTIDNTVELNLELIRRFIVSKTESMDPYAHPARMKKYAKENRIDNIVFGKAYLDKKGNIVFQMSVYDRVKNKVTITKEEKAENIFKIFDAANKLMVSLIQEFSKMHIGFGTIELVNSGEKGNFSVYIEGDHSGDSTFKVGDILNGIRTVEVRQNRMLGMEVIFSEDVWVYDSKVTKIEFGIPYLLDNEKAELNRLEGIIDEFSDRRQEKKQVIKNFDELLHLFDDISYCLSLETLLERYRQMEVEYRLQLNHWDIEDNFFKPKQNVFDELVKIYESADSYRDPYIIRKKTLKNASFFYNILGVNAAYDFSQGELARGYERYQQIDRMAERIPMIDYYQYEEEKRCIDDTIGKYLEKKNIIRILASVKTKKKLETYLGHKLKASESLFKKKSKIAKKELIILSNPSGMEVYVNDKHYGISPLRIKRFSDEAARVSVKDPWFMQESTTIDVQDGRNFLFFRSSITKKIGIYQPEIISQKNCKLFWDTLPDAVSYTVQIDRIDGNFENPFFEKTGIKHNMYLLRKGFDENNKYLFRVQAVNENKIKSKWSYSEAFEDRIKWSFSTGGKIFTSPAVGPGGVIYFGSNDRCLYALRPDGRFLWAFTTGGSIRYSPVVGHDGTIYACSDDRCLYAVNPDGTLKWAFATGGNIHTSPAVDPEGTVYYGSDDRCLYAVNTDGTAEWRFSTGGHIRSTPVIDSEGTVYAWSEDHGLYALNPDGTLKWIFRTGGSIRSSPVVDGNGTIYIGSDDSCLYALNPDGTPKWIFRTGGRIRSSPVVDGNGTIYIGSDDLCLYALNPDGTPKWIFGTYSRIRFSPYIDSDGTIYFIDCDRNIFALHSDGVLKWKYTLTRSISSSPAGFLGSIFIGSSDKRLYTLITGTL